jgi:hypothetical protein
MEKNLASTTLTSFLSRHWMMSSESVPSPTYLLKVKKAFQVILESTSISMDAVCITKLTHLYETLQHTCKTCL